METYFKINYEFDKQHVDDAIAQRVADGIADYICVADGVILNTANRKPDYLKVINGGMFAICDSGFVPLYLRWIYGIRREQYCGSDIFRHIVGSRRYRMIFLGTKQRTLDALKGELAKINPDVADMTFYELPFCTVDQFDYPAIARMVEADGADIIWVALGAPKQEQFMARLKPHLNSGVMIAVGAAFNFFSGLNVKRAPQWMVKHHLEFVYRIFSEPRKQLKRCAWIVVMLPRLLAEEWWRKVSRKRQNI